GLRQQPAGGGGGAEGAGSASGGGTRAEPGDPDVRPSGAAGAAGCRRGGEPGAGGAELRAVEGDSAADCGVGKGRAGKTPPGRLVEVSAQGDLRVRPACRRRLEAGSREA